jgi:hypothetical protein
MAVRGAGSLVPLGAESVGEQSLGGAARRRCSKALLEGAARRRRSKAPLEGLTAPDLACRHR